MRRCSVPSAACRVQRGGADHRRVGHGQGTGRACVARAQPATGKSLRGAEHLGDPRRAARVGTVRSRRDRSPVPTTQRRGGSIRPTAARCSSTRSATCRRRCERACCAYCGRRVLSRRRTDPDQSGRARYRRTHQNWKRARVRRGIFSRGSLPPTERHSHRTAAAAFTHRGRSRPARTTCARPRRNWARNQDAGAGDARAPAGLSLAGQRARAGESCRGSRRWRRAAKSISRTCRPRCTS